MLEPGRNVQDGSAPGSEVPMNALQLHWRPEQSRELIVKRAVLTRVTIAIPRYVIGSFTAKLCVPRTCP